MLTEPEVGGDQPGAQGAGLAERLGWHVHDQRLFAQALAHRSWCAEHSGREPNERLEFLGDAVLGLIVTDYLYRSYPDLPEGELAKARAAVVNSAALASTARELRVGDALLLGKGEDSSGGRLKPSILADAMEAVIGAVYLDAGYAATEEMVFAAPPRAPERGRQRTGRGGLQDTSARAVRPDLRRAPRIPGDRQRAGPRQGLCSRGHGRREARGRGQGRSKKQAEQMAARDARGLPSRPAPGTGERREMARGGPGGSLAASGAPGAANGG